MHLLVVVQDALMLECLSTVATLVGDLSRVHVLVPEAVAVPGQSC